MEPKEGVASPWGSKGQRRARAQRSGVQLPASLTESTPLSSPVSQVPDPHHVAALHPRSRKKPARFLTPVPASPHFPPSAKPGKRTCSESPSLPPPRKRGKSARSRTAEGVPRRGPGVPGRAAGEPNQATPVGKRKAEGAPVGRRPIAPVKATRPATAPAVAAAGREDDDGEAVEGGTPMAPMLNVAAAFPYLALAYASKPFRLVSLSLGPRY